MKTNKMKINTNRKPISSQEVNGMQDFGSVLKGAEATALPFYKKWWFMGGVGMAIVLSIIVATLNLNNTTPNKQAVAQPAPVSPTTESTAPTTSDLRNTTESPEGIESSLPKSQTGTNSLWLEGGNTKTYAKNNGDIISTSKQSFTDEMGNEVSGKKEVTYNTVQDIEGEHQPYTSLTEEATYATSKNSTTKKMQGVELRKDGKQVYAGESILSSSSKTEEKESQVSSNNTSGLVTNDALLPQKKKVSPKEINKKGTTSNSDNSITENRDTLISTATVKTATNYVTTKDTMFKNGIAEKKPSFNISYPVDPNDSLNLALQKVIEEIKAIEARAPQAPIKMDASKQNFTLKFDSDVHPELAAYQETTFGVADESHFTPALYKYKWATISLVKNSVKDSTIFDSSFVVRLSGATYIGEELFKLDKAEIEEKTWLEKLWGSITGIFKKKHVPQQASSKKAETSRAMSIDKTIRIIPVDSSQYYYQRSDYRSPVMFEIFPVLSDEQYEQAMKLYREQLLQHKKLLNEKQEQREEIKRAIKKRREERISTQRRKIEIYMGLSKDNSLQ